MNDPKTNEDEDNSLSKSLEESDCLNHELCEKGVHCGCLACCYCGKHREEAQEE